MIHHNLKGRLEFNSMQVYSDKKLAILNLWYNYVPITLFMEEKHVKKLIELIMKEDLKLTEVIK